MQIEEHKQERKRTQSEIANICEV
uniref:Uncharacterized protein n=1 Tax=Arundo donax TaxID=35708 RepID=A0A0A9AU70_ARUDO